MKKTISFTLSLMAAVSTIACSSEFEIASNDFENGDAIPASATCEGNGFGTGVSPELNWDNGPDDTVTYAISLIDWTAIDVNPEDKKYRGYHWVAWDIPASKTSLPASVADGQLIAGMDGAQQFGRGQDGTDYGYFGPCPRYDYHCVENNTEPRTDDQYSFVIYAMGADLPALPTPDMVVDDDGTNYQMRLDDFFAEHALETTQIDFVTNAAPVPAIACPE